MRIGFSYIGLFFLIALLLPNLFWTKNQPTGYETYVVHENRVLVIFERVGEVLVTCIALVFQDFNITTLSPWSLWLAAAVFLIALYEAYWIRYFRSPKTMKDFYSSLWGIPVAGATLPVCAFFLLGIYGRNLPMLLAVAVLGVGHIGIHLCHRQEILSE